jgi:hypothetical protein
MLMMNSINSLTNARLFICEPCRYYNFMICFFGSDLL